MTTPYDKILAGNPIYGILDRYTAVWGEWFYVAMIMGPYAGMWLIQKDKSLATMWLTCMLVAYSSVFGWFNSPAFYLLVVVWVLDILLKLVSPKYSW